MNYSYIIIDDDQESVLKTKTMADSFQTYFYSFGKQLWRGSKSYIRTYSQLIFLEIDPSDKKKASFHWCLSMSYVIWKYYQNYLLLPKGFGLWSNPTWVADYNLYYVIFIKSILKLKKSNLTVSLFATPCSWEEVNSCSTTCSSTIEEALVLCIKSLWWPQVYWCQRYLLLTSG
jgi:hypothetical protein